MTPNHSEPTGIDGYLDEISRRLTRLPQGKRTEIREKLRTQLLALVVAYEEQGHTAQEAVPLALRQFGEPATVARRIAKSQPRTEFFSLYCFAGAAAVFGGVALLYDRRFLPGMVLIIAFFVLPAVAGWMTGAAVEQAAGSVGKVMYILIGTGWMLIGLQVYFFPSGPALGPCLLVMVMFWGPVGAAAAELSKWYSQRRR